MATYLVTCKINAGSLQKGMSVLVETYQSTKITVNDVVKAFDTQKGVKGNTGLHNLNNFDITEVKK